MPKTTYCPFFINENKERTRVSCEGAQINFPSKKARREFIYPLCGSLGGYTSCPIYKMLEGEKI